MNEPVLPTASVAFLVIHGIPAVLKNSKQIMVNRRTGKRFVTSSDAAKKYRLACALQLRRQWGGRKPLDFPVNLKVVSFGPWKFADGQPEGNVPDASNLLQMPEDVFTEAGIIVDDRLVESHNGSHRVYLCDGPCPRRPVYHCGPRRGQYRDTKCDLVKRCPFSRVEIEITRAEINIPESPSAYLSQK